uniref:FLYWCH-type domain-containing protein n=1 Tax=Strongyloides venezuelensis TaxID=75913 RepID=A0A0K0FKS1_STRVS
MMKTNLLPSQKFTKYLRTDLMMLRLKNQRYLKYLIELKENNVNEINAISGEKIYSNVAITFKSNIFSNEYSMIVTGLNSERGKSSVIFVKNNSSNNMLICIGKRYMRSKAKNVFYCSSCRDVGSKMKPPKTLRTAIKVKDGKIVFQNYHVDDCENISFIKCFFSFIANFNEFITYTK